MTFSQCIVYGQATISRKIVVRLNQPIAGLGVEVYTQCDKYQFFHFYFRRNIYFIEF